MHGLRWLTHAYNLTKDKWLIFKLFQLHDVAPASGGIFALKNMLYRICKYYSLAVLLFLPVLLSPQLNGFRTHEFVQTIYNLV